MLQKSENIIIQLKLNQNLKGMAKIII